MTQFGLSACYWSRTSGPYWWDEFSADEVRRDFDAAAENGFQNLEISINWSVFQPWGEGASASAMHRLEQVLDVASRYDLTLSLTLFSLRSGTRMALPEWAFTLDADGDASSGGERLRRRPRDLYLDQRMRKAEARLVREIVGEFDQHSAVVGWVLGDQLSSSVQPPDASAFEDWLHFMAGAADSMRTNHSVWHAVSARDLVLSAWLDPAVLRPLRIGLIIADDWRPEWAADGDFWPAFLAAYAAHLSDRPTVISQLMMSASEEDDLERTLLNLRDAGAVGCIAPTLFELTDRFKEALGSLASRGHLSGLLDPSGRSTRSGRTWSAMASLATVPTPTLPILPDLELRRRDPEGVARTVYSSLTL